MSVAELLAAFGFGCDYGCFPRLLLVIASMSTLAINAFDDGGYEAGRVVVIDARGLEQQCCPG